MDEPRYTLAQARTELARRACTNEGHDYYVIGTRTYADPAGIPLQVTCPRCDTHWPIGAEASTKVTVDVSAADRELIGRVRNMVRDHKSASKRHNRGGSLPNRPTQATNTTGQAEPVTPPEADR